ncbi:hypothetical protein [Longimicrobium sp.]|uniref:hypothetical protein n=1 Tax=Longimicrobium sp. TaxID=2029185 RepID=UPI002D7EEA44|nr:hypothetical protein [Longimicrobium sp.]
MSPEAWRADLRFAVDSFLPRDRSFSDAARARFRAAVGALADSADRLSNEEMTVGLARAVALAENAHTRLYLVRNRSEVRRLPVRIWWFADGPFVVRAQPGYEALLGARLLRICGRPLDEVRRAVRPLYSGSGAWADYMAAYTMTSPEVLAGVRICPAGAAPTFAFVDRAGRRGERTLEPLPLRRSTDATEAWWDLAPAHPGVQGPWVSALAADSAALPLYLRDPVHQYWARYLPRDRTLYVQYNRAGDQAGMESFRAFGRRLLAQADSLRPAKIVFDLRFNTGGNFYVAEGVLRRLAALARERHARLFVITGPATFSAGIFHVAQLRQFGGATLVGEGPGDAAEFWAEGGNLLMPRSRLTLHYGNWMHSYARVKPSAEREFRYMDLYVDRITPEIRTPLTSRDYFAGRDPALDAILRQR